MEDEHDLTVWEHSTDGILGFMLYLPYYSLQRAMLYEECYLPLSREKGGSVD